MPLVLEPARQADARRIAGIHTAAFGDNAMLRAQFPALALREELLRDAIEAKALADMDDPKTTVLVVRDGPVGPASQAERDNDKDGAQEPRQSDAGASSGPVIAFAKWSHPVADGEDYVEPPWVFPEGTNWDVLDSWTRKVEEAQERAVGRTPCYRLTFMGTDPSYRGRGAASLLLAWGVEQCEMHGAPAYLESTLEAAGFYQKRGFTPVETFSLDISHGVGGGGIYSETSFVYVPAERR